MLLPCRSAVLGIALGGLLAAGCSPVAPPSGRADTIVPVFGSPGGGGGTTVPVSASPPPGSSGVGAAALLRSINLEKDYVPKGRHGRKVVRPMKPRYITIHSTQNWSPDADARRHAQALKNGKLRAPKRRNGNRIGYLIWHFSVDEKRVVQHMPTNEQGEHADFGGPGNRYSIGVEMCENRGNNLQATIDRTARLTAYLMHRHGIPLSRVVPHYHWPRHGVSKPHKNCPHFLLDNGRPGRKWKAFQSKVDGYHRQIRSAELAAR
jgi:N-acetylmuramoyl-L-alanine amidase